jgi:serine/threonine protein kinase
LELVDSFYDDNLGSYILVTPYYKLGSFEQLMGREWELDDLMLFFYQMAKAHHELFKNKICHLDLKPENILI